MANLRFNLLKQKEKILDIPKYGAETLFGEGGTWGNIAFGPVQAPRRPLQRNFEAMGFNSRSAKERLPSAMVP